MVYVYGLHVYVSYYIFHMGKQDMSNMFFVSMRYWHTYIDIIVEYWKSYPPQNSHRPLTEPIFSGHASSNPSKMAFIFIYVSQYYNNHYHWI